MAYVVIKNNNKQSYTLRNTANKPRVVLKSNGTSYIPLKVGTDTRATRLGFNINGGHYKAGGETSTTSTQSNTTYTYFGALTYRTSTESYLNTSSKTLTGMEVVYGVNINTTRTSTFNVYIATTTIYGTWLTNQSYYGGNNVTGSIPGYAKISTFTSYTDHVYKVAVTSSICNDGIYTIYNTTGKTCIETISKTVMTSYQPGKYAPYITTTSTLYSYKYTCSSRQYTRVTNTSITYIHGVSTSKVQSYDYGYNVEVGNTTTSVQTTTEV